MWRVGRFDAYLVHGDFGAIETKGIPDRLGSWTLLRRAIRAGRCRGRSSLTPRATSSACWSPGRSTGTSGRSPRWWPTVPDRVHLDLLPYPGDDKAAEVARLQALGATDLDLSQGRRPVDAPGRPGRIVDDRCWVQGRGGGNGNPAVLGLEPLHLWVTLASGACAGSRKLTVRLELRRGTGAAAARRQVRERPVSGLGCCR